MNLIPAFVKAWWRRVRGPDIEEVIDRHIWELYEADSRIESVHADRTLYGKRCIGVSFFTGLPIYDPSLEKLVPREIEGYPVQIGCVSSCCHIPDLGRWMGDPKEIRRKRRDEIQGKLEWRAAYRAKVLRMENLRLRKPKPEELSDEELQRYYYYLHIIWGIE